MLLHTIVHVGLLYGRLMGFSLYLKQMKPLIASASIACGNSGCRISALSCLEYATPYLTPPTSSHFVCTVHG